jgi:hypothetical protein
VGDICVEEFNPKGKKYYFTSCTEDFCYKNRHGICSLDLTEDKVRSVPTEKYPGEDDVNYCRDIYKSILKDGQKYHVYINSNKCGHYTFTDGQHRTCIASKKGLKLRAEIYQGNEVCEVCSRENKIQNSIINVEDMVKKTTYRKTIVQKNLRIEPKSNFQDSLDKWKKDLSNFQSEKQRDFREF